MVSRRAMLLGALSALLAPRLGAAAPLDRLWVVVSPDNPERALDATTLHNLFTNQQRFWMDDTPVVPFNAPARTPLRATFDRWVLKMTPHQAGRFWVDQRVRGAGSPPRVAPMPRVAIGALLRIPGAIAYVPEQTCLRGARVVAVVDADGVHPPPPTIPETSTCK